VGTALGFGVSPPFTWTLPAQTVSLLPSASVATNEMACHPTLGVTEAS
jgi:hypothetical protein